MAKEELSDEHKRSIATHKFLESPFWKNYFEPYLDDRLEKHNKITKLKADDLVNSYNKAKAEVDMVHNIKNTFKSWKNKIKLDGGD